MRNALGEGGAATGTTAGSAGFDTMNPVAFRPIDEINPRSIALDLEFSRSLFTRPGSFGFTGPVQGTSEKIRGKSVLSSRSDAPAPAGTTKGGRPGSWFPNSALPAYDQQPFVFEQVTLR